MMLLLAPWLMLAPLLLLLRRALWLQAAGLPSASLTDAAPQVSVSLMLIDDACRVASTAVAAGDLAAAARLLRGVQAGALVLVRDIRRALPAWGAATWALDDALEVPHCEGISISARPRAGRLLAWMERSLRLALPGNLGRLRVRLFVLGVAWRVLQWELLGLHVPRVTRSWRTSAAVQSDLHALASATLQAQAMIVASLRNSASDWRLAT